MHFNEYELATMANTGPDTGILCGLLRLQEHLERGEVLALCQAIWESTLPRSVVTSVWLIGSQPMSQNFTEQTVAEIRRVI